MAEAAKPIEPIHQFQIADLFNIGTFGGDGTAGSGVNIAFTNSALFMILTVGAIGVYVVLKGMSYIGHGLSHALFGGFAASSLLGVNFLLGAGAWGIVAVLPFGMAVALTGLELLVAALQAFVFAVLTCVYLHDAMHPGH